MTRSLGGFIRRHPRAAAAIAFGSVTAVATHFEWISTARMSGMAPQLTLAAGLAHAVAGAITGPRVIDGTRAQTSARAGLVGAGTSLLAVLILAPFFALWISAANARPQGPISFIVMTLLIGVFSFLGAGWPLLFVSAGVGWGLFRLADRPTADRPAG